PTKRREAGKAEEGTITLTARLESERVVVTVADDGGGLNFAAIAEKSQRMGLGELSEVELKRVIFTPGFSTAGTVSELAGRGVGLDVVAAAVRSIGGNVEIAATSRDGTVFALDLPLTLAVLK